MILGKKKLVEENVVELINDIKKKKELKELNDEFIREELFNYFKQNKKIVDSFSFNKKSKKYKDVVKKVRARLRRVYGLFRIEQENKQRGVLLSLLLEKKNISLKSIIDILKTHSSTKERLSIYAELYQKIFALTKKPKSIIDLGAGVNPFSIPLMKLKSLKYYAYDISDKEIEHLNDFFNYLHGNNKFFNGYAQVLDAFHFYKMKKVDLCFMFKMTDVLDRGKGHKNTEKVIKGVPAKYVVISFPTKTMSGKKMNFPRRKWIELMCERLGYKFKLIKFSNELFYVIKKK